MTTRLFLLIGFVLLNTISSFSQTAKRLDSLVSSFHNEGFNGNVLYSKNDEIIFTGNYGYTNVETEEALSNASLFELASCSKQFTALSIVQLVEAGKLEYSTKVSSLIEDFPYPNVTIEHLLRHQSGLPDYVKFMGKKGAWDPTKIATNQDVLNRMNTSMPKASFEPGTKYEYSNTGYLVLASIIEKISGTTYGKYLEENIFKPAGMTNSTVYRRRYEPKEITNMTQGHVYDKKSREYKIIDKMSGYEPIFWLDGIVGDGMVNSTLLDLEKWKQAIHHNKLISEEGKNQLFSTDKISYDYGFGFVVQQIEGNGKMVFHFGSWAGYETLTFYLTQSNEYIVILSNNSFKDLGEILNGILMLKSIE